MREIPESVVALLGEDALKRALAEATPGTALCTGVDIPFYPRLSIRSNARALCMLLQTEEQAHFWELLKLSGLRQSGWNVRRFKGDTGAQRLWGIVLGLMERPPALLALEPMSAPPLRGGGDPLHLYGGAAQGRDGSGAAPAPPPRPARRLAGDGYGAGGGGPGRGRRKELEQAPAPLGGGRRWESI